MKKAKFIFIFLLFIIILINNSIASDVLTKDVVITLDDYFKLKPLHYEIEEYNEIGFDTEELYKISPLLVSKKIQKHIPIELDENVNYTYVMNEQAIITINTYAIQKLKTSYDEMLIIIQEQQKRLDVLEQLLNVTEMSSEDFACYDEKSVLLDVENCPGGLSNINTAGLQTRCYQEPSGWFVCSYGWVKQ